MVPMEPQNLNDVPFAGADIFAPLRHFDLLKQGGNAYPEFHSHSDDEVIRVGALTALLTTRSIKSERYEEVLSFCQYGMVRLQAFSFFESIYEHELARRAANAGAQGSDERARKALIAGLATDNHEVGLAMGREFLETGDPRLMLRAMEKSEWGGGWREAVPWGVRAATLAPTQWPIFVSLYNALSQANQWELVEELITICLAAGVCTDVSRVYLADVRLAKGDPARALEELRPFENMDFANRPGMKFLEGTLERIRGDASEKLKLYRKAYGHYQNMNRMDRDQTVKPVVAVEGYKARGALVIPALPPDARTDCVMMAGFPRSGTTLLENALAAHPLVETFEEVAALRSSIDYIERVLSERTPRPGTDVELYVAARDRYYSYVDRFSRRPDAKVRVDKLPLRSGDAAFVSKLMPDMRFIFAVRHPFDVVLSCFKQRFGVNPAMANLHTIEEASRFYAFVMEQWFSVHSLDDPRVHYVRYHELVTDFQNVASGTLRFLGLDWDDDVEDFATKATGRRAKTPSYQKVRQGLSIGVQSNWKKYDFVFKSPAADPLRPWVRHFGYEDA